MDYEEGDEWINVDSLNNAWLASLTSAVEDINASPVHIKAWPNPFTDYVTIEYNLV